MSKVEEYAAFLDTIHLFQSIKDDHIFDIAENLEERRYPAGTVILPKGEPAINFSLIYSGKVKEILDDDEKTSTFVRGDYIGPEALIRHRRNTQIVAEDDVILLELPDTSIGEIKNAVNALAGNLKQSVASRRLIAKKNFKWLHENEEIYFLMRKHPFLLFARLFLPTFLASVGGVLFLLWWSWVLDLDSYWAISVVLMSLAGFLFIWRFIDWRNDYHIITNQRVVWVEKIIGIYDSRQEANLTEILSVGVDTELLSRNILDYGKLSVRIMVGSIDLEYMRSPLLAKHLVEELQKRIRASKERATKEELREAIVKKLKDPNPVPVKKKKDAPPKKTFGERLVAQKESHFLMQRFEQGDEIVYRKHFIVLLRVIFFPLLTSGILISYFLVQLYRLLSRSPAALSPSFFILLLTAVFFSILWVLYQYADWSNDIFKVSKDKIFDIDRKPLGDEQSRSAPLENIESLEYQRRGLLGVFFNYGTVYIQIGAQEFAFEDVRDPASVQQDIQRRFVESKQKKQEKEEKKEREHMLNWLLTYHEGADEFDELFNKLQEQKEDEEDNEIGDEEYYEEV